MATTQVTEWCSHCERENTLEWDVETEGLKAFCPGCGKVMMLCSECEDAFSGGNCSWNENTQSCKYNKRENVENDTF